MTCSLCHAKGHNKRGYQLNNQANAGRGRENGEEQRLVQQGQLLILLQHQLNHNQAQREEEVD